MDIAFDRPAQSREPDAWKPPRRKPMPGFKTRTEGNYVVVTVPRDYLMCGPSPEQEGRELRHAFRRRLSLQRWQKRQIHKVLHEVARNLGMPYSLAIRESTCNYSSARADAAMFASQFNTDIEGR